MHTSAAGNARENDDYASVVVFCGTVATAIAGVYYVLRSGFENPVTPIARALGLSLFLSTFPYLLRLAATRARSTTWRWVTSYSATWLLALGLTGILGRLTQIGFPNLFPLLGIIGSVAFVWILGEWLMRRTLFSSAAFVVGSALFGGWAAGVVWGRVYKNPLFFENLILNGRVHHDSLGLAALANMLRTYHVASPGLDGLSYMPYHWGSAWLFAQWSNLTRAHVLDFYQLGFPVTMIPFFFGSILAFSIQLRRHRGPVETTDVPIRSDWRYWLVFLAICIGVLPLKGLEGMGVWTSNILISESYTVGVPAGLLFLATTVAWWDSRQNRDASTGRSIGWQDGLVPLLVIPAGLVLLGYLKISVMVLGVCLALYCVVRLHLYRDPVFAVASVIMLIATAVTYRQVSLPAHREGFQALDFLRGYVKPAWWPYFPLVHLFWSWVYTAARLWMERISTVARLRAALRRRQLIDVETLLVIALLGLVPGLTLHIDGGSAFYFSDIQRWLAAGLLLSRLPDFAASLRRRTSKRESKVRDWRAAAPGVLLAVFLLIPVLGSIISNALFWPLTMVRENVETRTGFYPEDVRKTLPRGVHGFRYVRDGAVLQRGVSLAANYPVATGLRTISDLPQRERSRTALFIPQTELSYWTILTRPGACTFQSFVAPAIASIVMIDGMPPNGCKLSHYYGLGSFEPRTRPQSTDDSTSGALCEKARRWHLTQVLVLHFPPRAPMQRSVIRCRT